MANKRKVCVVTGTRAEYGLLKTVMEKIKSSDKLKLQILVMGMHLLPEFGLTIKNIEEDGFKIDGKITFRMKSDTKKSMVENLGFAIIDTVGVFDELKPDIVLVLGDRFEIFSAAIAASYSGRILAHIAGGDKAQAGYDEYTRNAITKITHLHFPETKKSAERIIKMGEDPKHVFTVGSMVLDTILNKPLPSKQELYRKYNLDEERHIFLVVQHSLSTSPEDAEGEIRTMLGAVMEFDAQIIGIYPNIDPGGKKMIEIIKDFEKRYSKKMKWYKSLSFEEYLGIMKIADVMIGNSSSGIRESSPFHLPVVNIGPRQKDRERGGNVIDVGYKKIEIIEAIKKALHDKEFKEKVKKCKTPYGDGTASAKIVKILSNIKIDKSILEKQIAY